jgi:hypothetical protein
VIAPVYILSIPGKLKILMDRFLAILNYLKDSYGKHAVSIGVAALREWHQLQQPLMNLLLLALGRRVVDSNIVYGAGPGEVLISNGITTTKESIKKLIDFENRPYQSQVSKFCPVDFSTVFERLGGDNYRCPICFTPAKATKDGFYFDAEKLNAHRWTRQMIQDHFVNWILKTKPRFKKNLKQIIEKKRDLSL